MDQRLTTNNSYFEKHSIPFYFKDILAKIIETRPEKPLRVLSTYFQSVVSGSNVVQREYEYVTHTIRNRISFAKLFTQALIPFQEDELQAVDIWNLAQLICPDIPLSLFDEASKLTLALSSTERSRAGKGVSIHRFCAVFRPFLLCHEFILLSKRTWEAAAYGEADKSEGNKTSDEHIVDEDKLIFKFQSLISHKLARIPSAFIPDTNGWLEFATQAIKDLVEKKKYDPELPLQHQLHASFSQLVLDHFEALHLKFIVPAEYKLLSHSVNTPIASASTSSVSHSDATNTGTLRHDSGLELKV